MSNVDKRLVIQRAKKTFNLPDPPPQDKPEVDAEGDYAPYIIVDEKHATQISESSLDPDHDLVAYVKMSLMTPTAVQNTVRNGKNLLDHVAKEKGFFIIALKEDMGAIVQNLIEDAIKDK